MRAIVITAVMVLVAAAPQPSPQYFSNVRYIITAASDRQNYFVVDSEIWDHARADLGDLRLYSGAQEVSYALVEQRGSRTAREFDARIINLGTNSGLTVFVVDASGAGQYNRVTLRLEAKDFISRASVEGLEQLHGGRSVQLGTFTVYDFSREQLGANSTLKLPDSNFPYLRVSLPGVAPQQVKDATVTFLQETMAEWTEVAATPKVEQQGRGTVMTWESPKNVPLDRIRFEVAPKDVNFRRPVAVFDAEGRQVARGELSRVHVQRAGKVVDSEDLALDVPDQRSARFRVVIDNGDDPSLSIAAVRPLSVERRVYFEPRGTSRLQLYYGDPVLGAPTYDYAKLFQREPEAAKAELGPGMHNSAYRLRRDERPWTDRHPTVLWIVLILAVLGLGAVAVRGLRSA